MHHQKEVFTYLEQRERCGYLGINQIGLGARSTQMLIHQNKQLILFLAYRMIILKCDVLCYVTIYTVSAFTYLLVYTEY